MANFQLKRGGTLLGRLVNVKWDMFWSDAEFEPTDDFLPYKPLFDEEYQALEAGDMDTVNRLQEQIDGLGLRLIDEAEKSGEITEFMLHVYGNEARFRASL